MLCTLKGRFAGRLARLLGIGTVLCGAGMLASCHSGLTQGRTPTYVVIDSLQAAEGFDFLGCRESFRLVEECRQRVETNLEYRN